MNFFFHKVFLCNFELRLNNLNIIIDMKSLDYFKLYEAEEKEDVNSNPDDSADSADDKKSSEDSSKENEETPEDEKSSVEKEEEETQDEFVSMLDDQGFVNAMSNAIQQYTSEKMLEDNYNSFTILPYIEFQYNDEDYGVNVEFESAVTINVDDKGKVIKTDIPNIDEVKYKTPSNDDLVSLTDNEGLESITVLVKDSLEKIKKVSR